MTTPAVSVDNISKRFRLYHERNQSLKSALMRRKISVYDEFWALRNVSFEVPAGSTFALIGSNGSGKSTLLKCLANILVPETGSITAAGRVAALLEVGSGFHPELSGRENVYLNGSILGMKKKEIDRKFDDIVDFSGISQFIDQPVKNYSSGMYVRLGFSVAIHVEPEILVVDEVLAVGDSSFQAKSREKFEQFRKDGRTVVLVSHSLGTVKDMCDNAAWLKGGELQFAGPVDDAIAAYSFSVHEIPPDIAAYVETSRDSSNSLGWPVSGATHLDDHGGGLVQGFRGGAVASTRAHGTFRVTEPIRSRFNDEGGIAGRLGWPVSEASADGEGTITQRFLGGALTVMPNGTYSVHE